MKAIRTPRLKLTNWTIPLVYTSVTLLFALVFPRIENEFMPNLVSTMSAPAGLAICSSIASGMIALTGIVFSLTFVMVQFSATAYSPRLVMWVSREPVVSHSLGVFIATFLYALTMTAWVDRSASGKVPFVSGWLVVGLLLVSMGMFIALIERISMLQVNRMLIFTGDQGRSAIAELYLSGHAISSAGEVGDLDKLPVSQTIIHTGRPEVVQAIDMTALLELANTSQAVIEVASAVGDTVMERTPLFRVRGGNRPVAEESLRTAIALGEERTFEQDPKYAIRLIVDIAIKALSPAINDPTTAVQALDQIEDLLLRLGCCSLESGVFRDQNDALRLVVPFPSWDDFLRLALDEIRTYGAESVQVMRRMMALIASLTATLPPERHPELKRWELRLRGSIKRSFEDVEDQQIAAIADRQGLGIGS